ncbi:adenylosuccinate synthetase, partial [Staphylococcus warneri]|uniref:adenylosuccinate synthetase n=1 Tax=Staphylococcus warneri TaxID=1292 RepID=UPI001643D234
GVLTHVHTVKISTAYEGHPKQITQYPANLHQLQPSKPIFQQLPPSTQHITASPTLQQLPQNPPKYLQPISQLSPLPISIF